MELIKDTAAIASIVDNIISGICVFALDEKKNIIPVYMNEGFYRMLGYSHKDLEYMLSNFRRIIIPDDIPVFDQGLDDILKDDGAAEFEFRTVTSDGSIRWLQVRGNLYGKEDGYPLMAAIILDVTERKSIEEELALQAERANILSESVKEHLIDYNAKTDVLTIMMNKSAYQGKEIVLKDFLEKYNPQSIYKDDAASFKDVFDAARLSPHSDTLDFRSDFFDGTKGDYHWYRATITSVRGADGYVARIVGRVVNIDEQKKRELELQIRADRDALTGLYNKGAATTLLTDALEECKRENQLSAIIMLDLDHFKSVNDTFGHAVGDKLLADVGKVLNDQFKGRDIVARIGGDEFIIYMSDIKKGEDALGICARLNKYLTKKIEDSQGLVKVTASIGIAVCDKNSGSLEQEIVKADEALYVTKKNGRNGRTLYDATRMETVR